MKNRVLSRDVASHVDSKIIISGWLHKVRKMGGLNFINIRDRTGLTQVLVEDKAEVEKLRGLQIGTVLTIEGKVVKDDRAPNGAEIHEPTVAVDVPVTDTPPIEIDKPIDHKPENHDTLFEYRVIGLRNINEQKTFKIRGEILKLIRQWMNDNEFSEIQTPKLLAGATEGGAEVFTLDYFGKEAALAQSPQFYKQIMVGVFERVYEIGQAYRAELSSTTRHMTETSMLDVELGYVESLEDVLNVAQGLVKTVVDSLWDQNEELLKSVNATRPLLPDEFPRITMQEVHELYSKANNEDTTSEKDLTPAEERWINDWAKQNHNSEAVFVTEFPASEMKFYHRRSETNPDAAERADLIFRGVELATIPLREHRHDKVIAQIKAAGIDPTHPGFKYFLMAFQYGMPAHGGFGFGIDRFVQHIVGLKNIKEATLFPRDINRLAP